jgi:hypothetical protein
MRVNKYFEFVQGDLEPIKSFYIKDELNPKLWDNFELDGEVREQLIKIAQDFYESTELKADVKDIILTGSLSNYNWSEKYSDYDLHILIDFNDVDDNVELVKKFADAAKKNWNDEHDIKIKGYEVEVYIQDIDEPHKSSGVFSLLNNKWNVKPEKVEFEPDEEALKEKSKSVMMAVDGLEEELDEDKYEKFNDKLNKVWDKIKNYRKSGLAEEGGELSLGNLVFKLLRRNGYIEKIMNLKRKSYDKQFESLSEDDILKLLYFIEEIDKKFTNSEGHSEYINCDYNENEDFIDINYGWSTYEEGSQEDMRVFYKESPIRVEWTEEASSVYGDYNNEDEYKFNSIDELISFIKNKYVDDEY